ncbi:hypothetical protein [Granulicella aggregans]|uniref:hypothetical protein n=1 Tax=Granulicella aggregans TaxID=474949 RepID=UPI0021DFFE6E|nr:hypothetical protein [Granulicella aggregans]
MDWIRERATPGMLQQIAEADAGEDSEDHLTAIKLQLSTKPQKGLLHWTPREVLELTRWSQPETDAPAGDLEAAHTKRLLACALLLISAATCSEGDTYDYAYYNECTFLDSSAATLRQFTGSALALGPKVAWYALELLLWFYERVEHDSLTPFAAFCILLLGLDPLSRNAQPQTLDELIAWVDKQESDARQSLGDEVETSRWLLGLNPYESSGWVPLTTQAIEKVTLPVEHLEKIKNFIHRMQTL